MNTPNENVHHSARLALLAEARRHEQMVRAEVNARKLDVIDPEWRTRFASQSVAEAVYWRRLSSMPVPVIGTAELPPDHPSERARQALLSAGMEP